MLHHIFAPPMIKGIVAESVCRVGLRVGGKLLFIFPLSVREASKALMGPGVFRQIGV